MPHAQTLSPSRSCCCTRPRRSPTSPRSSAAPRRRAGRGARGSRSARDSSSSASSSSTRSTDEELEVLTGRDPGAGAARRTCSTGCCRRRSRSRGCSSTGRSAAASTARRSRPMPRRRRDELRHQRRRRREDHARRTAAPAPGLPDLHAAGHAAAHERAAVLRGGQSEVLRWSPGRNDRRPTSESPVRSGTWLAICCRFSIVWPLTKQAMYFAHRSCASFGNASRQDRR